MVKVRALAGLLALLGLIAGCGGGSGGGLNPTVSNTPLLVNAGDASSDRVLAFAMVINSASLSNGSSSATLVSSPTRVEFTRRGGVFEPLAAVNVGRGTYSQVFLNLGSASVTFLDSGSGAVVSATVAPNPATVTVNLSPTLQVDAAPVVLNIDFNLGSSLSLGGSTVTSFTPVFSASGGTVVAASAQNDTTGAVQDVTGVVTASSSLSITIAAPQAAQALTFSIDASTVLTDTTQVPPVTPGSIPVNSVVEVTGVTQTNGTFLATRVELKAAAGQSAVEGIVVDLPALPATQFTTRAVNTAAQSSAVPALGAAYLATGITSTTPFSVDGDVATLTGLPFTPTFDRSTLREVQNVEVFSATPDAASVTAARVRLQEQSVTGASFVVTAGTNTATVTLTPDIDSTFNVITGQATLTVFQQPSTQLTCFTSVPSGARIRCRGLLFFDPGDNTFKMVATQITLP